MLTGQQRLQEILSGRYTVEREIGKGGYATVYLARDLRHHRNVAIKLLNADLASSLVAERFRAEIELVAGLVHPNIIPIFDSGAEGSSLYYVMPLVEGETLRDRMFREGRLSLDDTVAIARDVAAALSYAHARKIVHRDIKPENTLLIEGHALVTDFGIAKAIEQAGSQRLTVTGNSIGTPIYMSPEQANGQPVDERSDVYSLGCMVFEMLTGVPPISGTTPQAVMIRKMTADAPTLQQSGVTVPPAVEAAVAKALTREPDERFTGAKQFVEALATSRFDTPTQSMGIPVTAQRPATMVSGSSWVPWAVAALGVLVIAALGYVVAQRQSGSGAPADARMGLAVFPFRATMAEVAQLSEAIPDLLATRIDGTPGLRIADPWSLWRPLRATRGDAARSPDPEEGRMLASKAEACCFILGSVSQLQGRIEVSVRIYREQSEQPWHTFGVSGVADSLGDLVERTSVQIIERLTQDSSAVASGRAGRGLTQSPGALKDWLNAREYLRRGKLDSADIAITRSLVQDSNFVMALSDAVVIRTWLQFSQGRQYAGLRELAERAVRLSDSLPGRPRLRAQGMLASIETKGAEAARAANAILTIDNLDFDAWNHLSYAHMAYGWQYGVTDREIRDVSERVVRLDSTDIGSLTRRLYLAVALNDPPDIDAQLRRFRLVDTTQAMARGLMRGVEALRGNSQESARIIAQNTNVPLPQWIAAYRMLRLYRPDLAEALAHATLADASSGNRTVAVQALTSLSSAQSRWSVIDSMRVAQTYAQLPGFETAVDRMAVAASIAGATTEARGARGAAALSVGLPPDSALALLNKRNVWHDGWLVGAYHAMYGDTALARRWRNALGTLPPGGSPREYGRALQADLDARLAARQGDRGRALQHARRAFELWDTHTENQPDFMPEPAIRFQLATLLRDSNRPDSAAALLRSMVPPTTFMGFYTARAALELADLEATANRADAERHYLLASRLWERSDPSVAPLKERARRGLARLGGD
jgi:tetratricopeptide (TPR) repeat protein